MHLGLVVLFQCDKEVCKRLKQHGMRRQVRDGVLQVTDSVLHAVVLDGDLSGLECLLDHLGKLDFLVRGNDRLIGSLHLLDGGEVFDRG